METDTFCESETFRSAEMLSCWHILHQYFSSSWEFLENQYKYRFVKEVS